MAGAGKRTFIAGEVLTAAQVNDYLMDQAVMRFSGSAARAASITAPTEGMVTYLDDTNRVEFYNGNRWITMIDSGVVTAKGDLFVASASATVTRIGVGIDGQLLTASSSTPTGLAWTTAAGGVTQSVVKLDSGTSWSVPSKATFGQVWAIGGGGGGGCAVPPSPGFSSQGCGGGAGGLVSKVVDFRPVAGSTISYAIGGGGGGSTSNTAQGGDGGATTFGTAPQPWYLSATGGGGGGSTSPTPSIREGRPGGCGGGSVISSPVSQAAGGGGIGGPGLALTNGTIAIPTGTQGGSGGMHISVSGYSVGGAGANIAGYRVGGGGSSGGATTPTAWGGGQGGPSSGGNGVAGTAGTGGGGGGGFGQTPSGNGGTGGSGTIIIAFFE